MVIFGSGIRDPTHQLNTESVLAISMVIGFWFFSLIGEEFPRTACWILLLLSVAILILLSWLAVASLPAQFEIEQPWLLIAFAIYDLLALGGAAYHLFFRARSDPAV